MPCCRFWPVDEKQAYVDSAYLDKNQIIYLELFMEQIKYIE